MQAGQGIAEDTARLRGPPLLMCSCAALRCSLTLRLRSARPCMVACPPACIVCAPGLAGWKPRSLGLAPSHPPYNDT